MLHKSKNIKIYNKKTNENSKLCLISHVMGYNL